MVNGANIIVYSKLNIINDIAFSNLSLHASNILPKNVEHFNFLAKKPSIASVKNSIIIN